MGSVTPGMPAALSTTAAQPRLLAGLTTAHRVREQPAGAGPGPSGGPGAGAVAVAPATVNQRVAPGANLPSRSLLPVFPPPAAVISSPGRARSRILAHFITIA